MPEPLLYSATGAPLIYKEPPMKRQSPPFLSLALSAIAVVVSGYNVWQFSHKPAKPFPWPTFEYVQGQEFAPSTSTSTPSKRIDIEPAMPITDAKARFELASAIGAWEAALHRHIDEPRFLSGDAIRDCTRSDAVACEHFNEYTIYATKTAFQGGYDLRTVLMHEIGHLLGVPHIEGDALMNTDYTAKVEKPTIFAIALARTAR